MKKLSLLLIFFVSVLILNAQSDTTIIYNGNKIIITEDQDNVTVFVEKIQPDSTLFDLNPPYIIDEYSQDLFPEDSLNKPKDSYLFGNRFFTPDFTEKVHKNFKRRKYRAHVTGFFIGFSNLATQDLQIGNVADAALKLNSYELGWTMFHKDFRLSKRSRNYGLILSAGLGFRYNHLNADNNSSFIPINGYVTQVQAPDSVKFNKSHLSVWYLNIPVVLEWQKKRGCSNFFIQAGVEGGIKLSGRSKSSYSPEDDIVVMEKRSKLDINPLTLDAKLQVGFNNISIYARYGLINFYRTGRGATVIPVSAGINLHF